MAEVDPSDTAAEASARAHLVLASSELASSVVALTMLGGDSGLGWFSSSALGQQS